MSIASLLLVLAELTGLASVALEIPVNALLRTLFPSRDELQVILIAPLIEESMKALVFIFLVRCRRMMSLSIGDKELVLAAWWIGASFGFYEWSVHELSFLCRGYFNWSWGFVYVAALASRVIGHGAYTGLLGIGYWLSSRTRLAIIPRALSFLCAIGLHAFYNGWPTVTVFPPVFAIPAWVETAISGAILVAYVLTYDGERFDRGSSV